MRQKMVAGNWKMYGTRQSAAELVETIKEHFIPKKDVEVVLFPSFVFLEQTQRLLHNTPIRWGGQNMAEQLEGPLTGEISPRMLTDFGCHYVLVGHSERRTLFEESNDTVLKKFVLAGKSDLIPILCVGETKEQRTAGQTDEVIDQQLAGILQHEEAIGVLQNAIIAYEPVWAIGTGATASPEQAQEVHKKIRQNIAKYDMNLAQKLPILYGGSVKKTNAGNLFAMPDIDGGLIGGASLDALEFLEIISLCNNYY